MLCTTEYESRFRVDAFRLSIEASEPTCSILYMPRTTECSILYMPRTTGYQPQIYAHGVLISFALSCHPEPHPEPRGNVLSPLLRFRAAHPNVIDVEHTKSRNPKPENPKLTGIPGVQAAKVGLSVLFCPRKCLVPERAPPPFLRPLILGKLVGGLPSSPRLVLWGQVENSG
jgi:hypothetical protein